MTTRPVPIRSGREAWIVRRARDDLGDDLPHNLAVLVMLVEGRWAFIRDGKGRQRRIPSSALDGGSEYQGRSGHWYPEDHPLVHRSLEGRIAKLEAEGGAHEEIEHLRAILNRHPDVE